MRFLGLLWYQVVQEPEVVRALVLVFPKILLVAVVERVFISLRVPFSDQASFSPSALDSLFATLSRRFASGKSVLLNFYPAMWDNGALRVVTLVVVSALSLSDVAFG